MGERVERWIFVDQLCRVAKAQGTPLTAGGEVWWEFGGHGYRPDAAVFETEAAANEGAIRTLEAAVDLFQARLQVLKRATPSGPPADAGGGA